MSTSTPFSAGKNIIIPLSIIVAAVFIGGFVLFSGNKTPSDTQIAAESADLRAVELSVPGMFCAGCTASVEGYVSSMPGVKRAQARLSPSKSATVIYDPAIVTKDAIIKNSIFDAYGVEIISDEKFTGSVLPTQSKNGESIPQEIKDKSQKAASLLEKGLKEGKDTSGAQGLFNQVSSDMERGNFANANSLLDTIISSLQRL